MAASSSASSSVDNCPLAVTPMAPIPPKSKRKKCCQTHRKKWEDEVSWFSHSRKGDCYAYCKVCNKDLSCTEGGWVERHKETWEVQRATLGWLSLMWDSKRFRRLGVRDQHYPHRLLELRQSLCNMLGRTQLTILAHGSPSYLVLPSHVFPDSKIAKEGQVCKDKIYCDREACHCPS